jgi:hypothetical protein
MLYDITTMVSPNLCKFTQMSRQFEPTGDGGRLLHAVVERALKFVRRPCIRFTARVQPRRATADPIAAFEQRADPIPWLLMKGFRYLPAGAGGMTNLSMYSSSLARFTARYAL